MRRRLRTQNRPFDLQASRWRWPNLIPDAENRNSDIGNSNLDVGSGHVHTENLDWDVDNLPVFDDDDDDGDDDDDVYMQFVRVTQGLNPN